MQAIRGELSRVVRPGVNRPDALSHGRIPLRHVRHPPCPAAALSRVDLMRLPGGEGGTALLPLGVGL